MPTRPTVTAIVLTLGAMALLGAAGPARAGDFEATLEIASADAKQKAVEMDVPAASAKPIERPVFHVKAGQPLRSKWRVTCVADAKVVDIVVHFYIAHEDKVGQATQPDLSEDNVSVESAVTMDFDPRDFTSADMPFTLDEPGAYRVQVETLGSTPGAGHGHAATLDLVVDPVEPAKPDTPAKSDDAGKPDKPAEGGDKK
ncbi:MAG: hypothetical protein GC159_03140 [Phycisphaera sp.]|nr:hypothetical protein [Phycisphaera sp.]